MKKIDRCPLSAHALRTLYRRQALVDGHPEPAARARVLWRQRRNRAFMEIRDVLEHMATGRSRCMYCEDSEGTDIEHFYPKATHPERAFAWENYLLACSSCNSNYKRNEFPLNNANQPVLIDPTLDDPAHHLCLTPTTGRLVGLTERGECSIRICGLTRPILNQGRRDAWVTLCVLIPRYAVYQRCGEVANAEEIRETIRRFPFASALMHSEDSQCRGGRAMVWPWHRRSALWFRLRIALGWR